MKIRDLPSIYNIDKIRIYFENDTKAEFWCESTSPRSWEIHPKWKAKEIDYIEICVEECEGIILEIILK